MEKPLGFVAQGESEKVCHLRKSLHKLKQNPQAWFGIFSRALEQFGTNKHTLNHFVFYRRSENGSIDKTFVFP